MSWSSQSCEWRTVGVHVHRLARSRLVSAPPSSRSKVSRRLIKAEVISLPVMVYLIGMLVVNVCETLVVSAVSNGVASLFEVREVVGIVNGCQWIVLFKCYHK